MYSFIDSLESLFVTRYKRKRADIPVISAKVPKEYQGIRRCKLAALSKVLLCSVLLTESAPLCARLLSAADQNHPASSENRLVPEPRCSSGPRHCETIGRPQVPPSPDILCWNTRVCHLLRALSVLHCRRERLYPVTIHYGNTMRR